MLTGVCSGWGEGVSSISPPALCPVAPASAKGSPGAAKKQAVGAAGWKQVWLLIAAAMS